MEESDELFSLGSAVRSSWETFPLFSATKTTSSGTDSLKRCQDKSRAVKLIWKELGIYYLGSQKFKNHKGPRVTSKYICDQMCRPTLHDLTGKMYW